VEHYVIRVETSSASHPVYTGKRRNEIRNDQVAKFMARVAKAQEKNKPKVVQKVSESDSAPATTDKPAKKAKSTGKASSKKDKSAGKTKK
jgi:hypothetical protein